MLNGITRARAIQIWFGALVIAIAVSIALGASVSGSTAIALVALCLAPPAILLLVWPGVQPQTISEVMRGADRRP